MWHIKLVSLGGNGLVIEFDTRLDTLAEVEILVKAFINKELGVHCAKLVHDEDLIYTVYVKGHDVGMALIKDINPVPKGANYESDTRK